MSETIFHAGFEGEHPPHLGAWCISGGGLGGVAGPGLSLLFLSANAEATGFMPKCQALSDFPAQMVF